MKPHALKHFLTATTASLALSFGAQAADVTLQDLTQHAPTENSQRLATLMQQTNAQKPSGTPRIIILDHDPIAAWQLLTSGDNDTRKMNEVLGEYLKTQKAGAIDQAVIDAIAGSLTNKDAETASPFAHKPQLTPAAMEAETCLVSPYNASKTAESSLRDMMTTHVAGKKIDTLATFSLQFNISTDEYKKFVDAHEIFHCLDNKYLPRTKQATTVQEWVTASNQSESFSDVAGLLLRIKQGADESLIDKAAAMRSIRFHLVQPIYAKAYKPDQKEFYEMARYYTHPAIRLLQDHVKKVGVAPIRAMTYGDMRDLAQNLTDKADFTFEKFRLLSNYALYGADKIDAIAKAMDTEPEQQKATTFMRAAASDFASASQKYLAPIGNAAPKQEPDVENIKNQMLGAILQQARLSGAPLSPHNILTARNHLTDQFRSKMDMRGQTSDMETKLEYLGYGVLLATPEVAAQPPSFAAPTTLFAGKP